MSHDDFDVIVYKVLAYIMACAKENVSPSLPKAKEIAGVGDTYWQMVISSMLDEGLIRGVTIDHHYSGVDISATPDFGITLKGAQYLRDNSKMKEAANFLGKAFVDLLKVAIEATRALL